MTLAAIVGDDVRVVIDAGEGLLDDAGGNARRDRLPLHVGQPLFEPGGALSAIWPRERAARHRARRHHGRRQKRSEVYAPVTPLIPTQ